MQMEKVYILLTDTGTWLSNLVKLYTKAPYNHASISLDRDLDQLYSFSRKSAYNPFIAGFVREQAIGGAYSKFPNTTCVIYELEVTKEQYKRLLTYLEVFKQNESKYRYSILGILGVALNRPNERPYHYFCSQFVSEVLHHSGAKIDLPNPALTTPDDLRDLADAKLVYEGKLLDFQPIRMKLNLRGLDILSLPTQPVENSKISI